ncbi:Subtilisin-like protease 3 [Linum grandiflorum]
MKAFLVISFTFFFFFFSSFREASASEKGNLDTYIVFLEKPASLLSTQSTDFDLNGWYQTFLPETVLSSSEEQRMVHSYRNVITGFAAKLTSEEAKAMEHKEGFVSARVERSLSLHTTYTPKFLGLQQNLGAGWNSSNLGKGVIIGMIDTGIKYDHPSFRDEGMPPPPAKWKGKCEINGKTTCNNKLIGARSFVSPGNLTEDEFHGTHTAGEAAGTAVEGANVFGQANGTAMGIAPFAHLAMYKVCLTSFECFESTVLAAMDAAIEDGVDVLSLSLGAASDDLYEDVVALGAFRAMQNGIFVSCSAGNNGPDSSSLHNEAPWVLTVGASMNSNASATFCDEGSLKNIDVRGKIVLCQFGGDSGIVKKGVEVKKNGGVGMILINNLERGFFTTPAAHVLPASHINYNDGLAIKAYLNSTSSPTAAISFQGTLIGNLSAPQIALFSSRGPSTLTPGILKPDIIGPGPDDYIGYLCGLGYNDTQVSMIVQRKVKCLNESVIPEAQLNYPTFSISLGSSPQTYTRTVTNVGMPDSTYTSKIFSPDSVDVKVTPSEIKFKELNEKATYTITFSRVGNVKRTVSQGSLVWSSADNQYNVVSTIAVVFV